MKKAWVLRYPLSEQRRLRSAWASHSEDSDQTGRMPRLIWVFAGRPVILLVLSRGGSAISVSFSSPCFSKVSTMRSSISTDSSINLAPPTTSEPVLDSTFVLGSVSINVIESLSKAVFSGNLCSDSLCLCLKRYLISVRHANAQQITDTMITTGRVTIKGSNVVFDVQPSSKIVLSTDVGSEMKYERSAKIMCEHT